MREIPLTRGYVAIVDDEDCEVLAQYKWFAKVVSTGHVYAARMGPSPHRNLISMHRIILGLPDGVYGDHINGNTLDNRRSNLRACNQAENTRNSSKQSNNTSGYKGVGWRGDCHKYRARINFNGQNIHIGYFDSLIDAAMAYDRKAMDLFGNFARLNFPDDA